MSELLDLADRMSAGMALRYDPHGGGEHDYVRHLPRRTRRTLVGAGYLTGPRRGERPDVFADCVRDHLPAGTQMTDSDALDYWVRLVLRGLTERRTARRAARRRRLHLAAGHPTEYAYRTAHAIGAGFASFWQYRKARQWGTGS